MCKKLKMLSTKMFKCIVPQTIFLHCHFVVNTKKHGVLGLGKYYNMSFDTKLGYGTCAIRCIPCACTQCTPMLDKTWSTGGSSYQQPQYQLVKYFTDWPVLGYFKNWSIFKNLHKETSSEYVENLSVFTWRYQ